MKIAMIGQKGVPATHGGVERHVEELGARLVDMGHEVVVFTRPNYVESSIRTHRGMELHSIPTIGTKHLDAIVHSLLCTFATWAGGYDVVHYHAIGPCLVSPLARVRGRKVVATIHGRDWKRAKWGRLASAVLRAAEWMALHVPHRTICVSESLAQEYRDSREHVDFIPNGITTDQGDDTSVLEEFLLEDARYVLFAGRLVPEKGLHYLVDAWKSADTSGFKLVVAGDTAQTDAYVSSIRGMAGDDVVFTGYQYGARLAALFRHAALFVLPSDLEGLPLVLLEAIAYGTPVLASDIPPCVEVLGHDGRYFAAGDVDSLQAELESALGDLGSMGAQAEEMSARVRSVYDWDRVARETATLYESL